MGGATAATPSRRGRRRVMTAALTATALLAGCALTTPVPRPLPGPPEGDPCPVGSIRSCALPFPSDEFTVDDPSSATGRRPHLPDGVVPDRVLDRLGPGADPATAFEGADGWASLSPVIFEVDRPVVPGSVPADGGDVVAVFDTTTGERVPIRVSVPVDAARHGAPDTIVMAWPVLRFEHGRTYVARLSDPVRARGGGAPARAPRLLDATLDGPVRTEADRIRRELAAAEGDRWDSVLSATRFTVRSSSDATSQLDRMSDAVRADDHPVRRLRVHPPLFVGAPASAVVTGEVRITDFRDDDGVARVENGGRPTWVRFLLVLPETPAGPEGAPVSIYGHGLVVAKETMFGIARANAELGVATIGIDVPNHGDRQAGQGGYLLDLTTPARFGRLASMPLQGAVDQLSLLLAVRDHLSNEEFVPLSLPFSRPAPPVRLDPDRIFYQGTSMGGVLGAAFVGVAPEVEGAFLHVPGTGIADIIMNSLLWPLFASIVPRADTGDAYALMGAATMLLDPADNVNVLDRIAGDGPPVFLLYGANDGIVPNVNTDRMITLLDLPLVGRQVTGISTPFRTFDPPQGAADDDRGALRLPPDGRGATQLWPADPPELHGFNGHVVMGLPAAEHVLQTWLAQRLAASGLSEP